MYAMGGEHAGIFGDQLATRPPRYAEKLIAKDVAKLSAAHAVMTPMYWGEINISDN